MSFIPSVAVKPIVNAASGASNSMLQAAQKNFEIVQNVAKENGIDLLVVKIVNGVPTITINQKIAQYARVLGLKIS